MSDGKVVNLLKEWGRGNKNALDELIPLVLDDLRDIARRNSAAERFNHTLQPTALINELYIRLLGQKKIPWSNRNEFLAVATNTVRRILVEYARARGTLKRGGEVTRTSLEEALDIPSDAVPDLIALDDALRDLEKVCPRSSEVVSLHIFIGLTFNEISDQLMISRATVMRDWNYARKWLLRHLLTGEDDA